MMTQADLIARDDANYASASFPDPRPFQDTAHECLRQGARNGHKNQAVMAPTGGGKTYLGMRIIHESLLRGNSAIFVCDRTTLIKQTSAVADSYGLSAHGIIQANHWRIDPRSKFQIASVQTLARRGWPDVDVIVIDEAHCLYKAWTEHVMTCRAKVIGLSATPFSAGMGKIFTNLVNAATMHALTESGVLVPMRVYSCARINMRGAPVVAGEWSDRAVQERGMEILGDVVTEWSKCASDRKTIVFGATIEHCEAMCRQFNETGIMAATFTSDTKEEERATLLKEYSKPDSALRVLISVEALAKGFDVKDVGCLLEGSLILTDRGEIPIEKVLSSDKVWDGYDFVSHSGVIYKGEQDVIEYQGLTATHDHRVKTIFGWLPIGYCAEHGIEIVRTGVDGKGVRAVSGLLSRVLDAVPEKLKTLCGMRVHSLWRKACLSIGSVTRRENNGLRIMHADKTADQIGRMARKINALGRNDSASMACCESQWNDGKVHKYVAQGISKLWCAWNSIQVQFRTRCGGVDSLKFGFATAGQEYAIRQDRQQWTLRTWKLAMGSKVAQLCQYSARWLGSEDPQIQDGIFRDTVRRQDTEKLVLNGYDAGTNHREILPKVRQAKGRVWDILNAGPRNSFTCEGLLVHNCVCDCRPLRKSLSTAIQMWGRGLRASPETEKTDCILLDFSGNIVRFAEDYADIFYNGLEALDMGEKLDKAIRKDDDEKPEGKACPSCGYKPVGKRCVSCGWEHVSESLISHEAGEMKEFKVGKATIGDKLDVWQQAVTLCRGQGNPATAAGRAAYLYKSITGVFPRSLPPFEETPNVTISRAVLNKARANSIAFRMKAAA